MVTTYGSAEFKAHCLRIIDEVAASGQTVLLTKRGRPVARVVPVADAPVPPAFGWLEGTARLEGDLLSTGDVWDAE